MNGLTRKQSSGPVGPPPPEAASPEARLKGHLAHLTPDEASAFEHFKKLCAKEGFYSPHAADGKASHDEGTLM